MRVLFPLDGSERGYKAMEAALDLLKAAPVTATLLVVLQDFAGAPEEMVREFEDDSEDEVFPTEASAAVVLKHARQRLRRRGVEMALKTGKGDIVDEIIAESAHHDLLVMHSMAPSGRFRLRSPRTKKVIRGAKCNVLMMQGC